MVAALQQASAQGLARQTAQKQLTRLIEELEVEREKTRDAEERASSAERDVKAANRRELEANAELTRQVQAVRQEADAAVASATSARHDAEAALEVHALESQQRLVREAASAANAAERAASAAAAAARACVQINQ